MGGQFNRSAREEGRGRLSGAKVVMVRGKERDFLGGRGGRTSCTFGVVRGRHERAIRKARVGEPSTRKSMRGGSCKAEGCVGSR